MQSELTHDHEQADSLRRQSVLAFNSCAGGCIAAAATAECGMEKWMTAWAALSNIQDSLNRDYQLLEQAVERLWGAQVCWQACYVMHIIPCCVTLCYTRVTNWLMQEQLSVCEV